MAKATKICKVCGKEYEYCRTFKQYDGVFRYQDVACCPEHAAIYFAEVDIARGHAVEHKESDKTKARSTKSKIVKGKTNKELSSDLSDTASLSNE